MTLDEAFAALADPTRRELLRALAARPQDVRSLAARFPISRPAVSKHLAVLLAAGLVDAERSGRRRLYRLRPDGLREARAWLDDVSRVWDEALQRFQSYAEEGSR